MIDNSRVADVLRRFAELQAQGQTPTPEELCRDCPELLDAVRACLKDSQPPTRSPASACGPTGGPATRDTEAPLPGPCAEAVPEWAGRYSLYGEIARGGMGAVLHAHDDRLNRELAVKVLHPAYRDSAAVVRRFTDEAQIGGQLQHPGIVPVYDLGLLADGRPFFAMKLVKGRTLADLLRERPDPTHDLPRFLKVFEQVCQTVAYAHSRHVLHRDLKPANIMVGAFGEVQVMDWGIAKVLGQAQPEPSAAATAAVPQTEIHTDRSDFPGMETQAGAVLGTYAYMAPEQARGQTDLLDERCDVFGLGAILCEILTGQPAYGDASPEQVRVQALVADLTATLARLDGCKADAELPALARACLETTPERRPRDAAAVAAAITAYLAGAQEKRRQAELDRAAAQVKAAEERKRRRVTLVLAAALLLAVLVGGTAFTLVRQQRQARQEQTAILLNQALGQATALHQQARAAPVDTPEQRERAVALWRDALAAADRAEQALASGAGAAEVRGRAEVLLAELRTEAAVADRDRRMLARLERARELAAEIQESDYVRQRRVQEFVFGLAAAPAYAVAFRAYGIDVEGLSTAEAVRRIRATSIHQRLAVALDDWYFLDPGAAGGRLLDVARAADPDPLRDRVRVAIASKDRKALVGLAGDAAANDLPAPTLILLADVLHQQGLRAEALDLLKRVRLRYPHDFWVNDVLGLHFGFADPPDYAESGRCFAAAIALRPDSPVGWSNLGTVLVLQGRLAEAAPLLREGIRVQPAFTTTYERLCQCLLEQGNADAALAVVRQALRQQRHSPMMLTALGGVLSAQGKRDEAIATFRKVLTRNPEWVHARLALALNLPESGPGSEALQQLDQAQRSHPDLSFVHTTRGTVLLSGGDAHGALAAYRKAVALGPSDPYGWSGLGRALAATGQYDEALQAHRRAVDMAPGNAGLRVPLAEALRARGLRDEAVAESRTATRLNPGNVSAHYQLGLTLHDQAKYAEAASAFWAALGLQPNAVVYDRLGEALRFARDFAGAIAAYGNAIRLLPGESSFHNHLGHAYFARGRYADSVPHYREAVRLKPEDGALHRNLGNALRCDGKFPEAIASLRTAARLAPESGPTQRDLASALWQAGQYDGAVAAGRAAVRLSPGDNSAHNVLGLALERKDLLDAAIDEYREAVRLNPTDGVLHANLGSTLTRKGRHEEAILSLRAAVRLQAGNALYHKLLGDALLAAGRPADAVAACRKAVDLAPDNAAYRTTLARVLYRQRDYRLAETEARKAIALDPKQGGAYRLLGHLFFEQDRLDEAAAQYRQAIARSPRDARVQTELGNTLLKQRNDGAAETAFRQAVATDPKATEARIRLAILLLRKGRAADAEAELMRVTTLAPQNAVAHSRLSEALLKQGKTGTAVAAARRALDLRPASARMQFRLGEALAAQGQFAESLAAFRRAKQLRTPADDSSETLPWDERINTGQRLLELDVTLAAVRVGKVKVVAAPELAALGKFSQERKSLPLTAARLYAEAFATDRTLADDLAAGHRSAAARAAARAASNGEETVKVGAAEARRWRGQALAWLRAELDAWKARVGNGSPPERAAARQQLLSWRQASELAALRESAALAGLPEPERAAWKGLWAEVTVLLGRTGEEKSGR